MRLRGLIFTIKQVSVNNIRVFNSGTYLEYTDTVKTLVQVTFGIIENTHIV